MIKFLSRAFSGDKSDKPGKKRINLALQGGGAYGAFSWGVLDYLLDDGRLEIEGITGASAGAVNAVLLADGLARGGRAEARKRLADFWRAASLGGGLPDLQRKAIDRLFSFMPLEDSPMGIWFKAVSQYLSPYDFNPLNINPLKELIERFVDFDAIRKSPTPQLFVSATNVHTGRLRVFPHEKIEPMSSWRPPACRCCFGRSRSTACRTGMAAISAIHRSFHYSARPRPRTCCSFKSIRWYVTQRRPPAGTS